MPIELSIRREVEAGEKLLWSGRPPQGLLLRRADALLIPLSLVWGGLALLWEASALGLILGEGWGPHGPPPLAPILGAVFVLIGLYFMLGRFALDWLRRAHTYYGVTDRRAIIVSGVLSRRVRSLPLRTLGELSVTDGDERQGTIALGARPPLELMCVALLWPALHGTLPYRFECVRDPRGVCELIRRGRRGKLTVGADRVHSA